MSGHELYLVGSVPMANAEEVFTRISGAFGNRIKQIPDGETGNRLDWITWLEPVFSKHPNFEPSLELFQLHPSAPKRQRYQLKPGASLANFKIENLFYADIAKESYAVFKRLRDEGKIAQGTKFQVDLVPAHSVIWLFVVDALQAQVDPLYNLALANEIDKIAVAIPHEDLAIQIDVSSAVFARLQRGDENNTYGDTKEAMEARFTETLAGLANRVPADIDLLFHFCYGDSNHRHVVEPIDMQDMVDMANRLRYRIKRPITLIHMPVPRERDDNAYFAPLQDLDLKPETKLALGLVHHTDGLEGTMKRLATARKFVSNFTLGTECGFGRRNPETVPELLRIHVQAAASE